MSITLLNTDQVEELISLPLSRLGPGRVDEKLLGVQNKFSSELVDLRLAWWPDIETGQFENTTGSPIVSAAVLVEENQTKKTTEVAREDSDGLLTQRTTRDPVIRYDSGADDYYKYYPSGDILMMAAAGDYVYFLFEFPVRNMWCEVKTAGSYGSRTWEKGIASGWSSFTPTDNTSGFTVDGNIDFGAGIATNWVRKTIFGVTGYPIRVKAASVTTQAELDVCYANYVYNLPKCCLFGQGDYYSYNGVDTYTAAPPDFEYAGHGIIAYNSDPLTADVSLHANYIYKDPQPGVYELTFSESGGQWKCSVNGGADINITANGSYINKNVIPGMGIVFSSGITTSDEGKITISPALCSLWFAQDSGGSPDTFENNDIVLVASLASEATHSFWIKREHFSTADVTKNDYYFKTFFYEN